MTNGEWFMITTTQPLEVKRNGTCVWLCFDNEDANHYALPIKWWDEERVDTSEDLIRRSDAIKAIEPYLDYIEIIPFCGAKPYVREAVYGIRSKIKSIPIIKPKRGEWKYQFRDSENEEYRCSRCNCIGDNGWAFCPHCGAYMKGDKE